MTTNEIKKWLKETFGLKKVRIRSTLTKHPYFTAWIPYEGPQMTYPETFELNFREVALKVIYGPEWKSIPGREGNAGNVNDHSIAMHEHEWDKLIQIWRGVSKIDELMNEDKKNG